MPEGRLHAGVGHGLDEDLPLLLHLRKVPIMLRREHRLEGALLQGRDPAEVPRRGRVPLAGLALGTDPLLGGGRAPECVRDGRRLGNGVGDDEHARRARLVVLARGGVQHEQGLVGAPGRDELQCHAALLAVM